MTARPRAIVAHGFWGRGGAESAAMWIIEALAERFDVTVYTRGGFDLVELNELSGTTIPNSAVNLRIAKFRGSFGLGSVAAGLFLRSLRKVGAPYDLRVSLAGVLPWGIPALHFMSSIEWNKELVTHLCPNVGLNHRTRASRFVTCLLAGTPPLDSQSRFIANSDWLRRQCSSHCPGTVTVINPVVPPRSDVAKWEARENAVLVLGRLSPEKRIDSCIRIVEIARRMGFRGNLIIAGPDGAPDYANRIRQVAANHAWVTVLPAQIGEDKSELLGRYKYGLNACMIEAFGISSGEMASSGMIVLVPTETGQSEIITNSFQQYTSLTEAAEKLLLLSQNDIYQRQLHAEALLVRERFLPSTFCTSVRAVAHEMTSPALLSDQE